MDNKEKIILEKINREFRRESAKTELPQSLSTESITAMLKANQRSEKSNVVSLDTVSREKKQTERAMAMVKSIISVAAALVLVVMTALLYNARKEISVLTEQNNLSGGEMSPEKIEYHIINEVNKKKTPKAYSAGTAPVDKNQNQGTGKQESGQENDPEPTTLISEQSVPVSVAAGAQAVLYDTEFAVSDGSYIYRCIRIDSGYFVDIVSLSTLERVIDNPIGIGDRCDELSVQNNILTAIYKNRNSGVLLKFFDVSNKTAPALVREYYQKGAYEYLSFSGGKICLVTRTNGSPPDFTVNGKAGDIEGDIEINTISPYYTLISVTDADNLNSDFVRAKVHGELENFTFSHSALTASCVSIDPENNGTIGVVCKLTLDGNALTLAEKHSVPAPVSKMGVMNDGVIAAVLPAGRNSDLVLIRPGEGEFATAEGFYPGEVKNIYCLDGRIVFTGNDGMYTVTYKSTGEITVSSAAGAFNAGSKIFESDTLLISESAPDSRGKATWTVVNKGGNVISFSLDRNAITSDTGRDMLVSGSGVCAVPVTINGSKGYLFFSVDGGGSFSAYPTPYLYNGTGREICLISGDTFYVVSSNRVTAVSVSEIFNK